MQKLDIGACLDIFCLIFEAGSPKVCYTHWSWLAWLDIDPQRSSLVLRFQAHAATHDSDMCAWLQASVHAASTLQSKPSSQLLGSPFVLTASLKWAWLLPQSFRDKWVALWLRLTLRIVLIWTSRMKDAGNLQQAVLCQSVQGVWVSEGWEQLWGDKGPLVLTVG